MEIKNIRLKYTTLFMFILFVLVMTKGFRFSGWLAFPILGKIRYFALFFLPICTLFLYNRTRKMSIMFSRKIVSYFILTCLFTFFIRIMIYGGGMGYGLENNLFISFIFCSYFLFHYLKVTETNLMVSLTIIGILVLIIQVYQQLNPSMAMFSIYTEEMRDELGLGENYITGMRNGLYRFIPIVQHVPFFLFCYYLSKLLSKFNWTNLILVICFSASIYLMLTRMFFACMGIATLMIYYSQRKQMKSKFWIFAIIIFTIFLLFAYSDILFSSLFNSEDSDINYSSTARLNALPFIWSQALSNPILFITGHGYPSMLWEWGGKLGYWYNDLGIFGQVYPYGILWIIVYFRLVYWILVKKKHKIPIYVRAYVLGLFCICFMNLSYSGDLMITLLWCIILYISDLYITNSDKTEHNAI